MRQKLQEKGPSGSFIDRTNRFPAALTCGLNARVMSLLYANRGIEESGNGGMGSLKKALLFVPRMMAGLLLFICFLFMLMALVVVGWIRENYDDNAT